jgi:hypothetical protein
MWNSVTGSICINGYSNVKGNPNFETNQTILSWISKYQNRLITGLGIVLTLLSVWQYYRKDTFLLFAGLLILYIIGISGISSNQGDRFHLITYPFTLLLFAKYLSTKPFFAPLQK